MVRLCGTASRALPPFVDVTTELKSCIKGKCDLLFCLNTDVCNHLFGTGDVFLVNGGYYLDGRVFMEVDRDEIERVAASIKDSGIRNVVVSGIPAASDRVMVKQDCLPQSVYRRMRACIYVHPYVQPVTGEWHESYGVSRLERIKMQTFKNVSSAASLLGYSHFRAS